MQIYCDGAIYVKSNYLSDDPAITLREEDDISRSLRKIV